MPIHEPRTSVRAAPPAHWTPNRSRPNRHEQTGTGIRAFTRDLTNKLNVAAGVPAGRSANRVQQPITAGENAARYTVEQPSEFLKGLLNPDSPVGVFVMA